MSPPDKGRRRGPVSSNTHIFQGGASGGTDPAASSASSKPNEDQRKPRSRRGSNAPSARSISTSVASMPTTGTAAAAAAEALMKDKDLRIAQLERELSKESETASFWQAKHSALNQQFLRTDTELRMLRDDVSAREAETDDGDEDAAAATTARRWREAMENEVADRDDEIRALRAQVRGLKEWVSTSTRVDGTANVSDEVFGEGWARLGNGLQNWVITNFRKAKLDLSKADDATLQELAELVPMYEELLAIGAKMHLLQSLVSRILAQQVFGAYFVGLSVEQEEHLRRTEKLIATFGSVEAVNQWRSMTLSIMRREATERMQISTTEITVNVASRIHRILDAITTVTAVENSSAGGSSAMIETRDQVLRQLISNSIELARLLVVQRAVFEEWMPEILPHQQIMFDQATMEDIGGEDEESLVHREICCVTFPGVIKRGDENGSQLQLKNVISKARVLCGPE